MTISKPPCVGEHEANNTVCNGDPQGQTVIDKIPCAWRDRCVGLQAYCQERHYQPATVRGALADNALIDLCEAQIKRLHIVDGKVRPADAPVVKEALPVPTLPPTPKPSVELLAAIEDAKRVAQQAVEKARTPVSARARLRARPHILPSVEPVLTNSPPVSPTSNEKLATEASPTSQDVEAHTEETLRRLFPEWVFAHPKRVVAKPGTFYAVRYPESHLVRWYCSTPKGRDQAVLSVQTKVRSRRAILGLPVAAGVLNGLLKERVNLNEVYGRDVANGQFRCVCRDLDVTGVDVVLKALRDLVDAGTVSLTRPSL